MNVFNKDVFGKYSPPDCVPSVASETRHRCYLGDVHINLVQSWNPLKCNDILTRYWFISSCSTSKFYIKGKTIEKISSQLNVESYSASLIKREQINKTVRVGAEQRRGKGEQPKRLISKHKKSQEEREEAI